MVSTELVMSKSQSPGERLDATEQVTGVGGAEHGDWVEAGAAGSEQERRPGGAARAGAAAFMPSGMTL